MGKFDFDEYAEDYDEIILKQLAFFDKKGDYFAEYKVRRTKEAIDLSPRCILEYGCGIGRNIKFLQSYFGEAEIFGFDLSRKSLEIAERVNPDVNFLYPGEIIPEKKFDLIFISNVFHHVPVNERKAVAEHIPKLLKDNGCLFVFEHNPYNPVTRHIVNTCPLDKDAVLIKPPELVNLLETAGMAVSATEYTLFFPNFLKWLRPFEKWLTKLPLGGQYFLVAERS